MQPGLLGLQFLFFCHLTDATDGKISGESAEQCEDEWDTGIGHISRVDDLRKNKRVAEIAFSSATGEIERSFLVEYFLYIYTLCCMEANYVLINYQVRHTS